MAEQKIKVALLEKQSEFDKREATLEKELLARDIVSRSRSLLSQSQQTSPKTDEREGLTPLIDIEESESPLAITLYHAHKIGLTLLPVGPALLCQ